MSTLSFSKIKSSNVLIALGLILISIFVYWPALNGRFVYDDFTLIVDNRLITKPDMWKQIWLKPGEELDFWPLSYTIYRLTWAVFGNNPIAWHWLNFSLHLINTLLLAAILKQLNLPGIKTAAAIFLLHPLSVEAVGWISQIKTTFAWMLALLATISYFNYEKTSSWRWYVSAVVLFTGSLLAKTMAIFLPIMLSLYLVWTHGRLRLIDLLRASPFYLGSLVLSLISLWIQTKVAVGDGHYDPGGILQRMVTIGRNFWFYVTVTIFPIRLALIHPHWHLPIDKTQSWAPFVAMLGAYLSMFAVFRRHIILAILIIASWTLLIAPVLGFVGLAFMKQSPVADHWAYPSLAVAAALVGYVFSKRPRSWPPIKQTMTCVSFSVVAIFAYLTWQNAHRFRNSEALWRDTVQKNPTSAYAWYNLGVDLFVRQQHDEALTCFQKAADLKPDYAKARWALGLSLIRINEYDAAEEHYRASIAADPGFAKAYLGLGVLLYRKKDVSGALKELATATRLKPDYVEAWYNLGTILLQTGKNLTEAEEFLTTAVTLNPNHAGALRNLALIKMQLGDQEAAQKYLKLSEQENKLNSKP